MKIFRPQPKQDDKDSSSSSFESPSPAKKVEAKVCTKSFSSQYELGKMIGEGAHAIVRLGHKKPQEGQKASGQAYAIKIFRTGDPEVISTIRKTYQIAKIVQHPNIIKMHELYIDETRGYSHMVMEYSALPSLESQLPKFKHNEPLTSLFIKYLYLYLYL